MQTFLEDIRQPERDIIDEVQQLEERNGELSKTCMDYEEVNNELNEQIDLYQQAANERRKETS